MRPGSAQDKERLIAEEYLCPRCADRDPRDIVTEVITAINEGVKGARPGAELIAWNWSWNIYEPDPQPTLLAKLPADVIVMGDFERGLATRALDMAYTNEEYSLRLVGPSPRFQGVHTHQRSRQMPTYARIQIGTTHENGSVPYLPILPAIGEKYRALTGLGVAGTMTCWNFGNMISIATEAANAFSWSPQEDSVEETLQRVAARHVGAAAAPILVEAWGIMRDAMATAFPGTNAFMYYGPLTRGPAFPLTLERLDRPFPPSWLFVNDAHADDMTRWLSIFGPEHVQRCLRHLDAEWSKALARLEAARGLTRGSGTAALEREAGVARMCQIQIRSTLHIIEFLQARAACEAATTPAERHRYLSTLRDVIQWERENALAALPLVDADARLGFHGEAYGYLFNRPLIEAKIAELDHLLASALPALAAQG